MGGSEEDFDLDSITIVFGGGRLDLPDGFVPPLVRVASADKLGEAARVAPSMARLAALVEFVGKGVDVDDEGELHTAAAQDLARIEGIDVGEADGDDNWELSSARCEVALLVEWAILAGFIYHRGRKLYRTSVGKQFGADPLTVWKSAFEAMLELGVVDTEGNGPPWGATVDAAMADLVVTAALRDAPVPQDELLAQLWAEEAELLDYEGRNPEIGDGLREAMAADARRTWEALSDMGVLIADEVSLASTPLGSWAAVELLRDDGWDVAVVGG